MNEDLWLTGDHFLEMLRHIQGQADLRKLRLFPCGCCRHVWAQIPLAQWRQTVETAEAFADDQVRLAVLESCNATMWLFYQQGSEASAAVLAAGLSLRNEQTSFLFSACVGTVIRERSLRRFATMTAARAIHSLVGTQASHLLRDIFGNPFRPVAFDPSWRTSTALSLARVMYETRDFTAMPILADALQDAGCENADVLTHCRGSSPHVRGCWVVDLVLGKN